MVLARIRLLFAEEFLSEMAWVGIDLDHERSRRGEIIISIDDSNVPCLKTHTDQERVIARHTLELSDNVVLA